MSALRRRVKRPNRQVASWADPEFEGKQESRERVARVIAKYFDNPSVFVLPAYEARCAKTINRLVPNASFFGCDYLRSVVEQTASVDGKKIQMQCKSVERYIRDNVDLLNFDAAFLDYKADYISKRAEIQQFAAKMLKPKAVLAVTVQRLDLVDAASMILRDLTKVMADAALEDFLEYETTYHMINAVFLLQK